MKFPFHLVEDLAKSKTGGEDLYRSIADIITGYCFPPVNDPKDPERDLPQPAAMYHDRLMNCLPEFETKLRSKKKQQKTFQIVKDAAQLPKLCSHAPETLLFESALVLLYYILIFREDLNDTVLYKSYKDVKALYSPIYNCFKESVDDNEQQKMLYCANFMKVILLFFDNKAKKMDQCVTLTTILTESNIKRYTKGGDQNDFRNRREEVYHYESGTVATPRPPRKNHEVIPTFLDGCGGLATTESTVHDFMDSHFISHNYEVNCSYLEHPERKDIQLHVVDAVGQNGQQLMKAVSAFRKGPKEHKSSSRKSNNDRQWRNNGIELCDSTTDIAGVRSTTHSTSLSPSPVASRSRAASSLDCEADELPFWRAVMVYSDCQVPKCDASAPAAAARVGPPEYYVPDTAVGMKRFNSLYNQELEQENCPKESIPSNVFDCLIAGFDKAEGSTVKGLILSRTMTMSGVNNIATTTLCPPVFTSDFNYVDEIVPAALSCQNSQATEIVCSQQQQQASQGHCLPQDVMADVLVESYNSSNSSSHHHDTGAQGGIHGQGAGVTVGDVILRSASEAQRESDRVEGQRDEQALASSLKHFMFSDSRDDHLRHQHHSHRHIPGHHTQDNGQGHEPLNSIPQSQSQSTVFTTATGVAASTTAGSFSGAGAGGTLMRKTSSLQPISLPVPGPVPMSSSCSTTTLPPPGLSDPIINIGPTGPPVPMSRTSHASDSHIPKISRGGH